MSGAARYPARVLTVYGFRPRRCHADSTVRTIERLGGRCVRERVLAADSMGQIDGDRFDLVDSLRETRDAAGALREVVQLLPSFACAACGPARARGRPRRSRRAGVNGAAPGLIMEAHPRVGDIYYQELAAGIAEDQAEVRSLNSSKCVPFNSFEHLLRTGETSRFEPASSSRSTT